MPTYRLLPIEDCFVDPRYQRPIIDPHVERIVREYDPAMFSVLEASERADGRFAIFDGQQRLEAMTRRVSRGMEQFAVSLPALVHTDLTPEDESDLFIELQRRRRQITPIDKFKARLFGKDPVAIGMAEMAEDFRLKIGLGPQGIQAVVACERAYRRDNLEQTLKALTTVWRGDAGWLDAPVIDGLSRFLDLYSDNLDFQHLLAKMSDVAPKTMIRRGRELTSSSLAGGVLIAFRNEYSDGKHPLSSVEKAKENRVAFERESGRRYTRISPNQVRDAVIALSKEKPNGWQVIDLQAKLGGLSKAALTNTKSGHLHKMRQRGTVKRRYLTDAERAEGRRGFVWYLAPVEKATVNRPRRRPPEKDPPAGADATPGRGSPVRLVDQKQRRRAGSKPGEGKKARDRDREYNKQQEAKADRSSKDKDKAKTNGNGGRFQRKKKEPVGSK